jgi:predicted metal-dependent peptidase
MEKILEPLRIGLENERILPDDWNDIVSGLKKFASKEGISPSQAIEKFWGERMSPNLVKVLVKGEVRRLAIDEISRSFKFDRIVVSFLRGNWFFTEVSRWIKKVGAESYKGSPNPTAMMCYDPTTDDFVMYFNPKWMASFLYDHGETEGMKILEGVFHHELYHFILKHITIRRRSPNAAWNIATDAANNSLILAGGGKLPEAGVIPGKPFMGSPKVPTLRAGLVIVDPQSPEAKLQADMSEIIASWKQGESSDAYFNDLMQRLGEKGHRATDKGFIPKGQSEVSDIIEAMDLHDFWDSVPEERRELVEQKMKDIVRSAVRAADNRSSGWGNIPAHMQKQLRSYVDNRVDWKTTLSHFVGSFQRGKRSNTFKVINRRAPYSFPGVKRKHLPNIAVSIDMSGSVSDEAVQLAFGVLGALARHVTFTVIPFDTQVYKDEVFEWKKGTQPAVRRVAAGGTDFKAPCDYVSSGEGGKFDGHIIITDGECSDPGPTRVRRAWLIVPGHKLFFKTNELVINMDATAPGKGEIIG